MAPEAFGRREKHGREAVREAPDARGEDLGGDNEGGGVGAEVEEELGDGDGRQTSRPCSWP